MVGFLFVLLGFLLFAIWVWTIIDIIKSDFSNQNDKLLWAVMVILLPLIGTILYYNHG